MAEADADADDTIDVASNGKKREADNESIGEGSDGPTPVKRSKQGSLRGRKKLI
jgi:hypothetical protein